MSSNDIFALRKQGQFQQALETARGEYGEGSSDIWLLRAYAWSLYDHVKTAVEAYEAKALSPSGMSSKLSVYMREFSKMGNLLRKDSAFSQMLRLAGKASKDWHEFLLFARWAGVDDFSDEDKAAFTTDDGKTIDSLQKRFIRAICRETASKAGDPQMDRALIDWGQSILEQALQEAPNDQWLNYYQSKLHLAHGEIDSAIKHLAPILRRQARVAWPWALLGEILELTQPQDAITCYIYAVQLAREEQEVAKIRIHLARLLSQSGLFSEAALQVQLANEYREQYGYKIPAELAQLLGADWYRDMMANGRARPLADVKVDAKTLLLKLDQHNFEYQKGVLDHINLEKELSFIATGADTGVPLYHKKFPDIVAITPGTILEIGFSKGDKNPVHWRSSSLTEIPGFCQIAEGVLEKPEGKNFAFIRRPGDDIFIPPGLMHAFDSSLSESVRCLALWHTNKNKGKTGWKAIKRLTDDDEDQQL